MVKIDYLLFGYRKIIVNPEDLSLATSILLRAGIPSNINNDGTISIRERDFLRIKDLFSGRVIFSYSDSRGLLGKWIVFPHKKIICTSIVFSVLIVLVLSGLVWDVRVDGNNAIPDSKIVLALSESGFSVGDFWIGKNLSEIETRFLDNNREISWININRRGTVAYVSLMENDGEEQKSDNITLEYSNIVASTDCVIEEITVKSGIAVVKPGDAVKKGDLLILGALPEEAGGGFCSASGSVLGRIVEKSEVLVDRVYEKKTPIGRKLCSLEINIFKFSINIFKIYGNLTNKYDIIENEKSYSLFGKCKLPFSISLSYIPEYEYETAEYSDDRLIAIASDRLNLQRLIKIGDASLLKMKTYGAFIEEGYKLTSDMILLAEVGESIAFDIE